MKNKILASATLATFLIPASASAQIIYVPIASNSTAVPTLSGSMLILMSVLLVIVARRFGKKGSASLTVGLLGILAISSGTLGVKTLSEVYADGGLGGGDGDPAGGTVIGFIDSRSGGSVPINESVLNVFENVSGSAQRIVQVIVTPACGNQDRGLIDGVPRCTPNSVVQTGANGMCYTDCRPDGA